MYRLHDFLASGNGYKCRLLLHHLGLPFERVEVDILRGESRTEAFARLNPEGRVPVLEFEDGTTLPESNAILCFLAEGTPWLPKGRLDRAQVLRWLFWEQYSHEPNVATARHWVMHLPPDEERQRLLPRKLEQGARALAVMERHLAGRRWFVGAGPTVADLALYAYTHVAPEGGFDLGPLAAVRSWLARVAALPGHVPIDHAGEPARHLAELEAPR
ncbi:MAG TPA: glutathione S-transferase family protein [Anaeromyxobacteraceae bacterium]|nr:glutathione S-transferase family protein [Anaeromyxobacteraceae bacterium]